MERCRTMRAVPRGWWLLMSVGGGAGGPTQARATVEMLRGGGAPLTGCVLNDAPWSAV